MSSRLKIMTATAIVLGLWTPALAQDDTKHAVVDAQEQPVTQQLNSGVAAQSDAASAMNAANQRQYDLDRATYRAEVAARHEKIMLDQVAYERQQRAYADAMAAWRIQSDACKKGNHKACKAPTPVPADFY